MARIAAALAVKFSVQDEASNALRTVTRGGRMFDIGGTHIKLFPISVLAEAMDRTTRTIVDWERAGKFPKPQYAVPGSNFKRWYSERQVLFVNELWLKYRLHGKAKHFPVEKFLQEIAKRFYHVDLDAVLKEDSHGNG